MLVNAWEILNKAGGHFFSENTMHAFKSRTAETGYISGTRGYLVVSSKPPHGAREYRVSVTDLTTGRTAWASGTRWSNARGADKEARELARATEIEMQAAQS